MKVGRRLVLRGLGGAMLALPVLESLGREPARAQQAAATPPQPGPFAIFFRQGNGVACQQNSQLGYQEPERFWPTATGALTPDTMMGRAVDELLDYRDRLLIVGNVQMKDYDYGDGHARGALQGLTARGPTQNGQAGDSEASGVSLDHRIGAELNPQGRDSLFMFAGGDGGWLGGACISYRASGQRRAAFQNPKSAFDSLSGLGSKMPSADQDLLTKKRASINDLVRGQMKRLLAHPRLSASDKSRLQLHFDSIRSIETQLGCELDQATVQSLDGADAFYKSGDGDNIWKTARLHMDIATVALACGATRSVAIQIGNGNEGNDRFRDPDNGQLMENFHYISHRRLSHDASGTPIPGADVLHHKCDRQFGKAFKYLLDKLSAYKMPDGSALLDHGVAVWYNDLGNGPDHSPANVPYILAGSAGGYFKQGQYIKVSGNPNHNKMLNTLGAALGLRNAAGQPLDDFGDPSLPKGRFDELKA